MKLSAPRRQLAKQLGKVNQVLGNQVADFTLVDFTPTVNVTSAIQIIQITQIARCIVDNFYTVFAFCIARHCIALPHPIHRQQA